MKSMKRVMDEEGNHAREGNRIFGIARIQKRGSNHVESLDRPTPKATVGPSEKKRGMSRERPHVT